MKPRADDGIDDPDLKETLRALEPELDAIRRRHANDPPLSLLRAARAEVLPPDLQAAVSNYIATHPDAAALLDGDDDEPGEPAAADEARMLAAIRRRVRVSAVTPPAVVQPDPPRGLRGPWRRRMTFAAGAIAATVVAAVVLSTIVNRHPDPNPAAAGRAPSEGSAAASPSGGVRLADGLRTLTIAGDGTVGGTEWRPAEYRSLIAKALVEGRLAVDERVNEVRLKPGTLLGAADGTTEVRPLRPVGVVVETTRPRFQWQGPSGASYQVSVFDADYNLVAESGWSAALDWTVEPALARGARYSWQLRVRFAGREVLVPSPPAPEARLRVLGDRELDALVALRRSDPDAHLTLGIVYAQAGMFDEAERELTAAQAGNPESQVPSLLLADLVRLRGR